MGKAIVEITGELWKLCSPQPGNTIEVVSNDVPPDAELNQITYDAYYDRFQLVLSSPFFPDRIPGSSLELPRLSGPVFKVTPLSDG